MWVDEIFKSIEEGSVSVEKFTSNCPSGSNVTEEFINLYSNHILLQVDSCLNIASNTADHKGQNMCNNFNFSEVFCFRNLLFLNQLSLYPILKLNVLILNLKSCLMVQGIGSLQGPVTAMLSSKASSLNLKKWVSKSWI